MPSSLVMGKFKKGQLHSGSKSGPTVKNPRQAVAIMMHERENEQETGSADTKRYPKPRRKRGG